MGDTAHGVLVRTTSGAGQEIDCSLHSVCSPRATFGAGFTRLKYPLTLALGESGLWLVQDLIDGRDNDPGRPVDGLCYRARRVAELAGDLGRRQAGQDLRVVLRAGQDVPVGDVEERDRPGLVGAVDVGGASKASMSLVSSAVWACSGRPALSASSVVRSVSSVL